MDWLLLSPVLAYLWVVLAVRRSMFDGFPEDCNMVPPPKPTKGNICPRGFPSHVPEGTALADAYIVFTDMSHNQASKGVWVYHLGTGRLVSCFENPYPVRLLDTRFLNSTVLYAVMGSLDTFKDWDKVDCQFFTYDLDSAGKSKPRTAKGLTFPSCTHAGLLDMTPEGNVGTYFQKLRVSRSDLRVCGLALPEWRQGKGHMEMNDVVQEDSRRGRTWRVAGRDLFLNLAGYPNCSRVLSQLVALEERWHKDHMDFEHANSLWPLGDSTYLAGYRNRETVVALKPPSPRPLWAVGALGLPLPPPFHRTTCPGHQAKPTGPRSFVYFCNRQFMHGPNGTVTLINESRVMHITVPEDTAAQGTQLEWEIAQPTGDFFKAEGGGGHVAPRKRRGDGLEEGGRHSAQPPVQEAGAVHRNPHALHRRAFFQYPLSARAERHTRRISGHGVRGGRPYVPLRARGGGAAAGV